MHKSFLEILCDPITRDELNLEIIKENGDFILEGLLISKDNIYKITNGIPRFIKNADLKNSFGFQWKKWNKLQFDSENIGLPMEGHTGRMFSSITDFESELNQNKIFLDIGAGSGRFSHLLLNKNNKVVCIEVSNSVDILYQNFSDKLEKALIIQADFEKLPIKEETIDHAFSIGVLHHSKNQEIAFSQVYKCLKNNGSFAASVYSKDSPYNLTLVYLYRKFFNFLKYFFSYYPVLFYAYLIVNIYYPIAKIMKFRGSYLLAKSIFPALIYKDKRWSILDTFDLLSPKFASTHSNENVINWFKNNKFINLQKTSSHNACYKGFVKKPK